MALPYTPPGASVREQSSPSVSPLIASSANVALVGLAGNPTTTQTPITTTDTLILSGTTAVELPTLADLNNDAQLVAVTQVLNVLDPSAASTGNKPGTGYSETTDYTVQAGEAGPDGTNGTITRVAGGGIPDGTLVSVTYTYLPSDYWNPIRLYDIGAVETRFGPSWATATKNGQTYFTGINSQLSMAARIAFANGAPSVICQPLFTAAGGAGTTPQTAPTAADLGNSATWDDTLYNLRPIEDVDIIVPVVGQDGTNVTDSDMLNIFSSVQSHLAYMNSQQQYIVAILGEDGTSGSTEFQNLILGASGSQSVLQQHAAYLQSSYGNALSSQCVLLNNVLFQLPTPSGANTLINVGGQYVAAAIAGMLASRSVSSSLTRSSIGGFKSITDPRVPSQKDSDAAAGLLVVEQVKNVVRVRQGNTLDIQNGPARAELSVVRAKYVMMESIQQTLDNQVIGKIIADANSPFVVRSAISSVLGILQQSKVIVGYSQVTASLTSTNPTVVTASFAYQPAFPLNFVQVSFAIDLTNNSVTVSDGTGASTSLA